MATTKLKRRRIKPGWRFVKKIYQYIFKEGVAKKYHLKKLEFIGFNEQPKGLSLYETGGGFNFRQSKKIAGDVFLSFLSEKYKRNISFQIFQNEKQKAIIKITANSVRIKISLSSFRRIIENLGKEISNQNSKLIQARINETFQGKTSIDVPFINMPKNALADVKYSGLTKEDHRAVLDFYEKYIHENSETEEFKNLSKKFIIEGNKETLKKVIRRFEIRLKNIKFNETKWQNFLHTEVFPFISNYHESIRESDVNTGQEKNGEKKPDFVWIDIYGFIDVFEIKTPHTDILARRIDKSHDNYYFSSDASKAISQIEKYVLFLERNVIKYKKYMEKLTSMPFSVLKPKAILIIGNSKEYDNNDKKKEDFRLIRRALKNIEIITFNELLDNLKSIESKIQIEE